MLRDNPPSGTLKDLLLRRRRSPSGEEPAEQPSEQGGLTRHALALRARGGLFSLPAEAIGGLEPLSPSAYVYEYICT